MLYANCTIQTDDGGQELKEHGSLEFPAVCYHDDLELMPVTWHWHDEWEAIVLETGAAQAAVGGQRVSLRAGDGLFVNAGVLHGLWPAGAGECRLRSVVFHPRLVGGSMDSVYWRRYVLPLVNASGLPGLALPREQAWGREAAGWIGEAWAAGAGEAPGHEFVMRAQLSRLVFLLCQRLPQGAAGPSRRAGLESQRMKVMLRYIREHLDGPLTAGAIAGSANLSESECLRCFRHIVGMPPIQYLKQLRIQRAAELLLSTDRPIALIGEQCGFQSMSYFAKAFREERGRTPSEYRRERKNRR